MILSKTPILSTRLFPLPKSALRHRHNMVVGVFEGVVNLQHDGALRIYNAHLGARSQHDRLAQIISIRDTIRRAPAEGGAWTGHHEHSLWKEDAAPPPMPEAFVLLGDFNLEAKDPEYDHLVGPRDGDLGRISSKEDFIDTWVAAGHDEDEGVIYSCPAVMLPGILFSHNLSGLKPRRKLESPTPGGKRMGHILNHPRAPAVKLSPYGPMLDRPKARI